MASSTRSTKRSVRKRTQKKSAGVTKDESPLDESPLKDSNPKKTPFNPETLDRTVIAVPLLRDLEKERANGKAYEIHSVIIDLHLRFPGGRDDARKYVEAKIEEVLKGLGKRRNQKEGLTHKGGSTGANGSEEAIVIEQYLFARLSGEAIRRLVNEDGNPDDKLKRKILGDGVYFSRAIYHVWPDFKVRRLTVQSISTVKAGRRLHLQPWAKALFGRCGLASSQSHPLQA